MKIRLTQRAYETYKAHTAEPVESELLEQLLSEELRSGSAIFVRLHGNESIYLLNAYWNYSNNDRKQELLLAECVAYVAAIQPIKGRQRQFTA